MYDLELWKARKKELKLTLDDISERTGVSISTIKDIFRGATYAPRLDTVQAIEEALELTSNKSVFDTYPNIRPVTRRRIPMLGEIACGKPIYANEDRESYVEVGTDLNVDFCLTARGDSMVGARIRSGDIVFCKAQDMVNNGEIAAVIIGDEVTLKRVYYYPESQKLVLQAENPKYEPFVYLNEELNQIRILGKAVAFQSDIE